MTITPIRSKWESFQSDRERFHNQMHYLPVDRCFNMEFGYWDDNFDQWYFFTQNKIRNNEQADKFFNFDRIHTLSGPVWLLPAFEERVLEIQNDRKILINSDGLLAEVPLDGHDTIPHYLKSSIQHPDDWEKIKRERFRLDVPGRIVDIDRIKARFPEDRDYPLGVGTGSMIGKIRDMLTFEGLAYAIYDYPLMVEDMVETACQHVEYFLDQVLPHFHFDFAAGWEDIAYKGGPIVSVKFFNKVVVPRYKRIGEKLHQHGIDIWYTDCDGDVRPLLPGFLESGINCLFPFEVNGCAHPAELLDEYGKDLRIMGGIDKIELGKGRNAIRKYLQSVERLVERGGYIPFCDHRCPPNIDPDDYLFYLDLKEEMFSM